MSKPTQEGGDAPQKRRFLGAFEIPKDYFDLDDDEQDAFCREVAASLRRLIDDRPEEASGD